MFVTRRGLAALAPALIALAIGLGACAELPALEAGACGNGVVDPGEDCDGVSGFPGEVGTTCAAPGAASACHYLCADSAPCPAGWGCGADDVCSYASGFYDQTSSPVGAGFVFLSVGDSDADGHVDLLGQTLSGNLEAWYGDGSGGFTSPSVLSSGAIAGLPDFGSLDGSDALIDAVVPQPQGLFVVRSAGGRSLAPLAYPAFEIGNRIDGREIEDVLMFTLAIVPYVSHAGALLQETRPGRAQIVLSLLDGETIGTNVDLPTTRTLEDRVGAPLHVNLDVIPEGADAPTTEALAREELVLGFAGDDRVLLYRFQPSGPFTLLPSELPAAVLPAGLVLAKPALGEGDGLGPLGAAGFGFGQVLESRGIHLGDLDGDGDPDLLARATASAGAGASRVVVFLGNGDGTFGAGAVDTRFDDLVEQPLGCPFRDTVSTTRWPIAVGDVNADGRVELVGTGGIYLATELGLCAITPGLATWSEAVVDDFNRDGLADLAAVSLLTRQVDFRIGTPSGLFNRFTVPTENPPTRLRTGDFDGDLVRDLAVVELDQLAGSAEESLSVLFGESQGAPSPPVSMGRLDQIIAIDAGSSPFDLAGLDATTDLLVQSRSLFDPTGPSGVAVLVGTSQRRMLAPLTIAEGGPETRRQPIAVRIGRFLDEAGASDPLADLLVVALAQLPGAGSVLEAWVVNSNPVSGEFDAEDPYRASFDCTREAFDVVCATYATGDLDVSGGDLVESPVDEIIGIDGTCDQAVAEGRPTRLATFRMSFEAGAVRLPCATIDLPEGLRGPLEPRLADVDADGDLDAVIVFGGVRGGGEEQEGRAIVIYPNAGGSFEEPLIVTAIGATGELLDAGVLNADADPELEIAILSHEGVWIQDAEVMTQVVYRFLDSGRLTVADVNEDGLDDLLVSDFFQTYLYRAHAGGKDVADISPPLPVPGAP